MCLAQGPQRSDAGEARTRAGDDINVFIFLFLLLFHFSLLSFFVDKGQHMKFWVFVALAIRKGSDKPVQMLRLARTFTARMNKVETLIKANAKHKCLIPLDSWVCMNVKYNEFMHMG